MSRSLLASALAAGQEKAQVALYGEDGARLLVGLGRHHDLGEEAGDRARGCAVEQPIGGDHAAEGAHRIAGPRLLVSGCEGTAEADAAGVAVFDDGDCGRIELAHQPIGRVGIGQIVVARLLALDQRGLGDAGRGRGIDIERGDLMGILTVAQHLAAGAAEREAVGKAVIARFGLGCETAGDGGVVGGRAREGRRRQASAQGEAGGAAQRLHFVHHRLVVRRLHHHGHVFMVLGCRPDHGRAPDIDGLDAGVEPGALPHRLLEGVEVDRHKVDAGDPVRLQRRAMVGVSPPGENPAVDRRVQGLHPPAHDLGKAGVVGDIGDRDPGIAQDRAVPPVERMATPRRASADANASSLVLSETETSARAMGRPCVSGIGMLPDAASEPAKARVRRQPGRPRERRRSTGIQGPSPPPAPTRPACAGRVRRLPTGRAGAA